MLVSAIGDVICVLSDFKISVCYAGVQLVCDIYRRFFKCVYVLRNEKRFVSFFSFFEKFENSSAKGF